MNNRRIELLSLFQSATGKSCTSPVNTIDNKRMIEPIQAYAFIPDYLKESV